MAPAGAIQVHRQALWLTTAAFEAHFDYNRQVHQSSSKSFCRAPDPTGLRPGRTAEGAGSCPAGRPRLGLPSSTCPPPPDRRPRTSRRLLGAPSGSSVLRHGRTGPASDPGSRGRAFGSWARIFSTPRGSIPLFARSAAVHLDLADELGHPGAVGFRRQVLPAR